MPPPPPHRVAKSWLKPSNALRCTASGGRHTSGIATGSSCCPTRLPACDSRDRASPKGFRPAHLCAHLRQPPLLLLPAGPWAICPHHWTSPAMWPVASVDLHNAAGLGLPRPPRSMLPAGVAMRFRIARSRMRRSRRPCSRCALHSMSFRVAPGCPVLHWLAPVSRASRLSASRCSTPVFLWFIGSCPGRHTSLRNFRLSRAATFKALLHRHV